MVEKRRRKEGRFSRIFCRETTADEKTENSHVGCGLFVGFGHQIYSPQT